MIINKDTIYFKSLPEFFEKEKDGRKPNTVRSLVPGEYSNFDANRTKIKKICIVNSETREPFFRILTDISEFKNLVIFSWAP